MKTLCAGAFSWITTIYIENTYTSQGLEEVIIERNPLSKKSAVSVLCIQQCVISPKLSVISTHFVSKLVVEFNEITLNNSVLTFQNIQVNFKKTELLSSKIFDGAPLPGELSQVHLYFLDCHFISNEGTQMPSRLSIHQTQSVFVAVDTTLWAVEVNISAVTLVLLAKRTTFLQGFVDLKVKNTIFLLLENSKLFDQFEPGVRIQASKIKAEFTNSTTHKSKGGVVVIPKTQSLLDSWIEVQIQNCTFQENKKMGSGAALELLFQQFVNVQKSFVNVVSCKFIRNVAVRTNAELATGGAISLYQEEFHQGIASFHLEVFISDTLFKGNQADNGGGAVYVSDILLLMVIVNCEFSHSLENRTTVKGHFLMGYSDVIMKQCIFITHAQVHSESLVDLQMTSSLSKIVALDITVQCLMWHKLKVKKTLLLHENAKHVLRDFSITCASCPQTYYVLSQGIFQIRYDTSLSDVTVDKVYSNCLLCPTGGECPGNNLLPKPNYWGFSTSDNVIFYQCPEGYCCQGSVLFPCTKYNECARNRGGILCGTCVEGYSLSILSSNCVSETKCCNSWFWIVACFGALLYMLWYTLKDDVIQKVSQYAVHIWSKNSEQQPIAHKGYFGILIYFVQASAIFRLKFSATNVSNIAKISANIETYLSLLLTVEVSYIQRDICLMTSLSLSQKQLLKFAFLATIFLWWWFLHFVYQGTRNLLAYLSHRNKALPNGFSDKLMNGLVNIIKYTYGGFTDIVFHALVCVSINNTYVWFHDASVQCYNTWHMVMLVFGIVYVIPFPFVIFVGMTLLKRQKITGNMLLVATFCPLLFLVFWLVKFFKSLNLSEAKTKEDHNTDERDVWEGRQDDMNMYNKFLGEYRDQDGAQYWESVMTARRLLLNFATLAPSLVLQLILSLSMCILFLVHHVITNPFVHPVSNKVELLSLFLLGAKVSINLVRSIYISLGISPDSPQADLLISFAVFESLCLPSLLVVLLVLEMKPRKPN